MLVDWSGSMSDKIIETSNKPSCSQSSEIVSMFLSVLLHSLRLVQITCGTKSVVSMSRVILNHCTLLVEYLSSDPRS